MSRLKPIEWTGRSARIIDQTLLPNELHYEEITSPEAMFNAIRELKVRGAPLIGVSAAYGAYLSIMGIPASSDSGQLIDELERNVSYLAESRPTAVNLFWALERMLCCARKLAQERDIAGIKKGLLDEALAIHDEDRRMCRAIGETGYELLKGYRNLQTHCNAGGLATAELGTALSPIYVAQERGHSFQVFVDETRPLLQGARITAFELMQAGIPVTLICDNMAATVMRQKKVDAVIVGADRIAANGDVANKVGTYGLALIAKSHGIPFFVAAPSSTLDLTRATGDEIPIEERSADEVTKGMGRRTAPKGVVVYNPAFDVTPNELVSGIITEKGVFGPPYCFADN
jgi:methylthioribose-1-phosphate isomerase